MAVWHRVSEFVAADFGSATLRTAFVRSVYRLR